jgi:hypothetical protein
MQIKGFPDCVEPRPRNAMTLALACRILYIPNVFEDAWSYASATVVRSAQGRLRSFSVPQSLGLGDWVVGD